MARIPSWPVVLLAAGFLVCRPRAGAQEPPAPKVETPVLLRGRVTSAEDGRVLAGATVTVRDWFDVVGERGVDVEPPGPVFVIEALPDGTFAVPASDLEGPVITVAAKGHAPLTWREDMAGAEACRDVVLPEAAKLEGRVVDPEGAPAAHARVFAVEWDALDLKELPDTLACAADLLWGSGQYDDEIAYRCISATAGADGVFRIAGADAAKRYAIVAASAHLGPSMLPTPLVPGATLPDLRLDPTAAVHLRVVTEKGEPIAVDRIKLRGSPRRIVWSEVRDGVYRISPVGPGAHVLELGLLSRGDARHDFTLPSGANDFETVALVGEGATISGTVFDTEGLPVAGAWVNVQVWDARAGDLRCADVTTDAEGRFSSTGHPAGPVYLYVMAEGFQQAHFHELEQPVTRLAVTIRRARAVTLDVSPPKGVPRRDDLEIATCTLEGGRGPWVEVEASWDTPVTIEGVPLGRAAIRIWTPGAALFERDVVLEAGEGPVKLDRVRLQPARVVKVRVVDEEGMPVPGLKVHAEFGELPPVDWTALQRTTGADGLAVLELHAEGPVTVYVEAGQGRQRERRTIEIPEDPAKVVDVRAGPRKR